MGQWDTWRALWVIFSLVLLLVFWALNPGSSLWKAVFAALAAWRLLEIFVTGLGTALKQEQQIHARSLVTIVLYGLQLTLIFAILYHSFATTAFVAEGGPATRASDFLYISWSNITSLSNSGYAATNSVARSLEVLTVTAGILLLGVLLAFGIDAVNEGSASTSTSATGTETPPESSPPPPGQVKPASTPLGDSAN